MIEAVSEKNLDEVLPLIREYQAFYQVSDISDAKNNAFFSQFGELNAAGCQFIFREASVVVGYVTVYFTFSSTLLVKVAILNDLYVSPRQLGKGIGKQLIEYCRGFALSKGAARLQWVTTLDNKRAQKLYDSMNIDKSLWYFYTYSP